MIRWDNQDLPDAPPCVAFPAGTTHGPVELTQWVKAHRPEWESRLHRSGALLFRGFGFETLESFEQFAQAFVPELQRYTGGASPRRRVHGNVYNSTEASAALSISQHHEGAYLPGMPRLVAFFCAQPAARGGRTPLAPARKVTARIPSRVVDEFRSRKVLYVNRLHGGLGPGRSWQAQFESADRGVVETILKDKGYDYEWREDGGLTTRVCCEGVIQHPATGDLLWVSQADHWHPSGLDAETRGKLGRLMPESDFPFNAFYGDGGELNEDDLALVRNAIRAETVSFPWQKGDVLVCDNYLVSHGREPFEGERKVYAALG